MSASDKTLETLQAITDSTKSELWSPADISKSLHQEGNWYIIPAEYCYWYTGTSRFDSHVFHVCGSDRVSFGNSGSWGDSGFTRTPYTCWRTGPKRMQSPCKNCGETPPEGLVGLWFLHNWDYLCLND